MKTHGEVVSAAHAAGSRALARSLDWHRSPRSSALAPAGSLERRPVRIFALYFRLKLRRTQYFWSFLCGALTVTQRSSTHFITRTTSLNDSQSAWPITRLVVSERRRSNDRTWRMVGGGLMGLLTASRISQFREIREREVIAILHFILEESQRGNADNMTQCFSIISTNNITQMIMNERCYCVDISSSQPYLPPMSTLLPECIAGLFALFLTPDIADFFPILKPFDLQDVHKRGKALHQKVDKFFEVSIEEHRQRRSTAHTENYKEDFVDALQGLGQTKGLEEPLSMDAVKRTLLDMIGGASETSATTSVWTLREVLKNPRVLKKVQEELDGVVRPHRQVNEEDLPQLQYLNAVVSETLRLHPPIPSLIPHESSQDCDIEGFHIPARTRVFVNLWGMHRDLAVWERHLEFNLERFLNSKVDFRGRDFEFLPFGSGRRICPGINLSYFMVLCPLSVLLRALDWTLPAGQKPEELDMSETFKLVLEKTLPFTLFGKARLPHHVLYPAQ